MCLVWEGRNERLGPEFYRAVVGQTPEQVLFGDNADRLPIGIEDRQCPDPFVHHDPSDFPNVGRGCR